MKALKFLLPILLISMLAGCNNKGGNSSVVSSNQEQESSYVSSSEPAPSSSSKEKTSFTSLSVDPVDDGCSVSGSLIEIMTGCYLETGSSYQCSLSPTHYANKAIRIVMSDESIATTSYVGNSTNTFDINTHKQGDVILKIYAVEDDYLLFRYVVHVRDPFSKTEIEKVVFDTYDIWNASGIYGQYTMSFFTIKPLSGLLYGKDDFEATTLNFSLEYVETKKIFDFTFHSFNVVVDSENSSTSRKYTELDIAVTGDNILFYYEEGLLEMFRPSELYTPSTRY